MATQTEILNELKDLVPELQKIGTEIDGLKQSNVDLQAAVAALQDQIAKGEVSQDLKDAADAVAAAAQAVDDKIPDAPTIPAAMKDALGTPAAPAADPAPAAPPAAPAAPAAPDPAADAPSGVNPGGADN